jgi:long-chain fatty acid transport protein
VKVVDLTLSLSLAVTDRFSVGGSLIAERAEATLSNAVDFGTALAAQAVPGFLPQGADGFASVHGTNTGYGWQFGALWRPTDALQIGYTHRSEIDHDLEGTLDFTVPAPAAAVFQSIGVTSFNDTAAVAPLTLPSVDSVSLSYALTPKLKLLADVTKTGWSSLRNVTIYRADGSVASNEVFDWKDTYFYSIGAEYALSDTFTLRAGVAYDQTPTNDVTRTPRLPDQNRHWASVGLTWMATPTLEINGGYTHIQVSTPTINGAISSSGSILTGSYDSSINLFGVSAQYRF